MMKTTSILGLILVLTCDHGLVAGERSVLGPLGVAQYQIPRADGPAFAPQPEPIYPPAPSASTINPEPLAVPSPTVPSQTAPRSQMAPSATAPSIELYPRVRYKDLDEKHPRAVTTIVSVPDPSTGWKRNAFGPLPIVHVAVCVPPNCGPPKVKYKSFFREYEFDYGKYAVDVRLRDGGIEVDYQD